MSQETKMKSFFNELLKIAPAFAVLAIVEAKTGVLAKVASMIPPKSA